MNICSKKNSKKKYTPERALKLFGNILNVFLGYHIKTYDDLTPSYSDDTYVYYAIENITSRLKSQTSVQFLDFFKKNKKLLERYNIKLQRQSGPVIINGITTTDENDNVSIINPVKSIARNAQNNNNAQSDNEDTLTKIQTNIIEKKLTERKNSYIVRNVAVVNLNHEKNLDRDSKRLQYYTVLFTVHKDDITKKILNF